MSTLEIPTTEADGFALDWEALVASWPWLRSLAGCPQDPVHHAEGDVWIHTRMVAEAMAANPVWRALPEADRALVYSAALLHDISKPDTTRTEPDGRITAKGHSKKGEVATRALLWELGVPFKVREEICGLIRFHQIPFFLIERDDAQRVAAQVSQVVRCHLLGMLTDADGRGRVCHDQDKLLTNIELFRAYCEEQGCLSTPRRFGNDHSRVQYFRTDGRDPDYVAFDDTTCEVVMMCGLPGSGKDTWIARNKGDQPIVSLDDLRKDLDVEPGGPQGEVIQAAQEQCREHLRARRSFIFNATNLTREIRGLWLNLFVAYKARVRVVYVEVPFEKQQQQNREREARVPDNVIRRMLSKWELPDLTEVHQIDYILG